MIEPDAAGSLFGVVGDGWFDVEQARRAGVVRGPSGVAVGGERGPGTAHLIGDVGCGRCGLTDQRGGLAGGEVPEHQWHVESVARAVRRRVRERAR